MQKFSCNCKFPGFLWVSIIIKIFAYVFFLLFWGMVVLFPTVGEHEKIIKNVNAWEDVAHYVGI